MNVLHHAARVVGWCNAQVVLHFGIPSFGQFADFQFAFKDFKLEFKAQHDVKVVGDFVGFNPNQAWLHAVNQFVHGFCVHIVQAFREIILQFWKPVLPKSKGASNQVFPQTRLAFVNGAPATSSQRGAAQMFARVLFVHRVSSFVESPEQCHRQVIWVVTGGHSSIVSRETCGERVRGGVQTPSLEVVTEGLCHLEREGFLFFDVVMTG